MWVDHLHVFNCSPWMGMKVISKFFAVLFDSDTKSVCLCATVWACLQGKFLRVESMVWCLECTDGCFPIDLPTRPGMRRRLLTPPWHWQVSQVLIFANPLWLWIFKFGQTLEGHVYLYDTPHVSNSSFFNLLFCTGVWLINSAGTQPRMSTCPLSPTPPIQAAT